MTAYSGLAAVRKALLVEVLLSVVADLQHITVYIGCNSVFLAVFRIACE